VCPIATRRRSGRWQRLSGYQSHPGADFANLPFYGQILSVLTNEKNECENGLAFWYHGKRLMNLTTEGRRHLLHYRHGVLQDQPRYALS